MRRPWLVGLSLFLVHAGTPGQRHLYRHEAHPVVLPAHTRALFSVGQVGRLTDEGLFIYPGIGSVGTHLFSAWSPSRGHVDLTSALPAGSTFWRVADVGRSGKLVLVVVYGTTFPYRHEVGLLDTRTVTYAPTDYVVQTIGGYVYGSINANDDVLLVDSLLQSFQAAAVVRNGRSTPLPIPQGYVILHYASGGFALDDMGRAWGILQSGSTATLGTLTSPPTFVGPAMGTSASSSIACNALGDVILKPNWNSRSVLFDRTFNLLPALPGYGDNPYHFADDRSCYLPGQAPSGFPSFVWSDRAVEVDALFDDARLEFLPASIGWRARDGRSMAWLAVGECRWAGTLIDGVVLQATSQRTLALQFPGATPGPTRAARRIQRFPMNIQVAGGDAGQPVGVFVQWNGVPLIPAVALGAFDARGQADFTFQSLPVYAGMQVDLVAYTIDPSGRIVGSPARRIAFG